MGYQLIETVTVGSGGVASIQFTGIPQDGVDLVLVVSGRASWASAINGSLAFNFNSNSSGYGAKAFGGYNGSLFQQNDTAFSNIRLLYSIPGGAATPNTFGSASLYVSNYRGAVAKLVSLDAAMENNAGTSGLGLVAGIWNNTAAITSIRISHDQDLFVQNSTASLYKITAD